MSHRLLGKVSILSRRVVLAVEDFIIPPACTYCERPRVSSLPLCRTCVRIIRNARPEEDEVVTGLPWVRALFRLTPPLHGLIHGFKYRHQKRHIAFLCHWLRWRQAWSTDLESSYDAVIPVPLHSARKRERGYNQAQVLAKQVSVWGRCPVRRDCLRRVVYTETQTHLGGRRRGENLEGVFRADESKVHGKRVLLVDDVCTTGSTLSHCRDELLRAGAARVDALVIAWVERKKDEPPLPDFASLELAVGFFG
jgi:ComF family protein